jgi:hypothetical protein
VLDLCLDEWCDELSRSGELFLVLFTNEYDGMSYVRAIPASQIEEVRWRPGDYQSELRYRQSTGAGEEEQWWYAPAGAPEGWTGPVMLHYAVNRPVGAVRGESDLAPILPWLRRYTRWLEDRVRLNAAVRAFLWVVRAPARLTAELRESYRTPPEAGSVIIAHQDEEWEAVAPNLQARDANADGRAIRWMIAAGGPGTSLLDFGEGEDANLATARASAEVRRRFLTQRQGYFAYLLADLLVQAFRRYGVVNSLRQRRVSVADVVIARPDIAADDNEALAKASLALVEGLGELQKLIGPSQAFKRFALRLFVKFVGESVGEREFDALAEAEEAQRRSGAENGSEQRTPAPTARGGDAGQHVNGRHL